MEDFNKHYTKAEVMEILNINHNRFNTLVRNGVINETPNPGNVRRLRTYNSADVEKAQEQLTLYGKFTNIKELAEKYKTYPNRIKRIADELEIDTVSLKNSVFGRGERVLFNPVDVPRIEHYLMADDANKGIKKTQFYVIDAFYNKEHNIALYQPFYSAALSAGETARVIKHGGEWGFIEPEKQTFMPFEHALSHYGYFQEYQVNTDNISSTETEPLAAQLCLELNLNVEEEMKILDFIYQRLGIYSMKLELQQTKPDTLLVYLIKNIIPLRLNEIESFDLPLWQKCLKRGQITIEGAELFLISPIKRTTIMLELESHDWLVSQTKLTRKTINELVNEAVLAFKKNNE